jgi:DNA-binding ferritin-like protein (Dps family)
MAWYEKLTGVLEQKKQYKHDMARIDGLPQPWQKAAKGVHRYLMYAGGITDGDDASRMITGLADLFERAAADGTPVHEIVGDDPVGFAEDFAAAYAGRQWIDKERQRLRDTIADAEDAQPR